MTAAAPTLWQRLYYTRLRDAMRGRFDASLDWRLVVGEVNLPDEIKNVISQVVRGTRLWRREKVDVAAELAAHFQDGLEAGCSPDDLLKSFGDEKQAAKLIRRAKKRGRPMLWHAWVYGWLVLAGLSAVYVATGLYMVTGKPSIKTDYLAILNERPMSTPEDEGAWPLYRDALLAMGVRPVEFDASRPTMAATAAEPGGDEWGETERFLTDHAAEMAKLREAASRPELGFVTATSHAAFTPADRALFGVTVRPEDIKAAKHQPVEDRWVVSTLLPYLNVLRTAATLFANDARRAALAGDGDTAVEDIKALIGMGQHCQELPMMVNLLVADAVQRQARTKIQDVLRDHPNLWSEDQLHELAHCLAAAPIDWRRGFIGERMCFYDSMQHIYTDDGDGDGRLALRVTKDQNLFELLNSFTSQAPGQNSSSALSNGGLALLALPAANMIVASRKEMTETYERLSDRALTGLETPLWKAEGNTSVDEEVLSLQQQPLGKFRYLFVNLLLPAYDTLRKHVAQSNGERDGVFLGLALESYHKQHGTWPKALDELSPRWLPNLPVDAFTGKELHYKVVGDRPIVYSVGIDGDDDGGRLPDGCEGDATTYRISPPTEVPSEATDDIPDWRDGDWVIWSTIE